ncbi:hypothetical protein FCV25MIE_18850 [Fagus crenata]
MASYCPSQPFMRARSSGMLYCYDLESQDGFLDIISDDEAAEDGSEGAEGKQALSFHEFDGHTLVDEQGDFPTIVNNEIGTMKIYDRRSSRFSLSSHGVQQRFLS